jgi:hypothetical protein
MSATLRSSVVDFECQVVGSSLLVCSPTLPVRPICALVIPGPFLGILRQFRSKHQLPACLNLSAFAITDTELRLIAAAASIGLMSNPKVGNNAPAAIGIPSAL